jgi:hypothetical protein
MSKQPYSLAAGTSHPECHLVGVKADLVRRRAQRGCPVADIILDDPVYGFSNKEDPCRAATMAAFPADQAVYHGEQLTAPVEGPPDLPLATGGPVHLRTLQAAETIPSLCKQSEHC